MNNSPKFWQTKEHKRFTEFCDACRRYRYIGLCYGVPGVGKTLSARHYAHWHKIEPYLTPGEAPQAWPQLSPRQMRTMLYTPTVMTTPARIRNQIRDLRVNLYCFILKRAQEKQAPASASDPIKRLRKRELIIIDEADRLNMAAMEEIRDLYDRQPVAVIFIGMPGLEKRVARFPQLYSRVGFVHNFRRLDEAQMRPIIEYQWRKVSGCHFEKQDGTHAAAWAAIVNSTNGNFRLIERLFAQIERVLKINQLQQISQEVIEVARESLVIGVN